MDGKLPPAGRRSTPPSMSPRMSGTISELNCAITSPYRPRRACRLGSPISSPGSTRSFPLRTPNPKTRFARI